MASQMMALRYPSSEVAPIGGDIPVIDEAIQQMRDLMYQIVLPADDVSMGPPISPPRVVALSD